MGLDNGISLKIKDKAKFGELPSWMIYQEWEKQNNYDPELLYWRKCWNVREVIFNHLHENHCKIVDDCSEDMSMPLEVFISLCEKLMTCYTEQWWTEHDDTIWSYKEIKENYPSNLLYAMCVAGYLSSRDPSSYEIYFYDSY